MPSLETAPTFQSIYLEDKERVSNYFYQRFLRHVDLEKFNSEQDNLETGFERMCGLKGSKLSGGQKQRIAIARALIKNPKILILDEATSALDEHSQEIVQQALEKAMHGRTSIVIAHRMSTIKTCDRIIVLHKGKVVEDGSYDELVRKNGYFAKLEAGIA